jgi:proteasome lid subunit RPN8/RPN11
MKILDSVIREITEHAQNDTPIEACGYLAGSNSVITNCFRLTNIDNSPEHFSFDPKEQFTTMRKARELGIEIIGNYHSHPETPARPSVEDIKLAYDPEIIYVIVSLSESQPVVKAFSIKKGKVEEIIISILHN